MVERLIIVDGYNLIHRTPALRPAPDRTLVLKRSSCRVTRTEANPSLDSMVAFTFCRTAARESLQCGASSRTARRPSR